ncbi:hypothetical protein Micbo1qcDRAFT_205587 [Microdochium bolleyi]|uniref:IDI-2 n=1 Tax=Microdochium bolleyi TaxID=196109 RepID=A0A136IYE6_9PEZI|nr:hypothetical protein Micbo1qcDRAFT_205587 [Microdochium bolleyi]
MKFSTIFQTIAIVAASGAVSAAASNDNTSEACAFGGEYHPNLDALKGTEIDPNNIRKCKEHPKGSATAALAKRDCFYDAPYGCHEGYCWKQCGVQGSGQWCWTASNGGFGPWIGCSTNAQCNGQQDCGVGPADCDSCGCSC